jgi:Short C-terminal domain
MYIGCRENVRQPTARGEGILMGMRRRTRRRALVAGAAISHHRSTKNAEAQQASADYQEAAPPAEPAQYAPPPVDPAAEIEHLSQLHDSGAMTDEEFAAAKAKVLGT